MDMVTKSRKRSRKTSDLLAIPLPEDHEHDLAKFEILGIEVTGVPGVRVINQPIGPPPPRRSRSHHHHRRRDPTNNGRCEATIAPERSLLRKISRSF